MSTTEIGKALAKAFGQIDHATKNASNPHFKSTYANLAEVLDVIRKVFRANDLAVVQFPGPIKTENGFTTVSIITNIIHSSGEMLGATMDMPVGADKNGKISPHAVGSSITFGRRYALAAVAGITQDDDDGNAGSDIEEEEEEDNLAADEILVLEARINTATTRKQLKEIKTAVSATGDAELVAKFQDTYKALK